MKKYAISVVYTDLDYFYKVVKAKSKDEALSKVKPGISHVIVEL